VDAFVVARVPLERDLDLLIVLVDLVAGDALEQRVLRGVEVLHEVDDAAGVAVRDLLLLVLALVDEVDLEAFVEEGHRLQALEHGAGHELDALGHEHGGIRPERDGGAGPVARRLPDGLQLRLRLAALGELLPVAGAIAVDLDDEALGQRVHDAHTDAVEPAGDLVAVAAELATGVQHGEHDLDGALALVRPRGVRVDRDAAPVVLDAAGAVGEQVHIDAVGVARHRLVDGVVDHLPDEVVQPGEAGRADVHPRPFADGIEALEDLDVLGAVVGLGLAQDARSREGWMLR
jgi:hypothetical protein